MEILGIGMLELIFIVIVALIIMGPKDMQKAGKTIGKFLRNIVTSDGWRMFQQTSRELRTLPNRLMREANEELEPVKKIGKDLTDSVNPSFQKITPPTRSVPAPTETRSSAAPESQTNESDSKKDA